MAIKSIEDGKILRRYCANLGRKGVAERIIEIAQEIVKGEDAYQSTLKNAGKIRALALGATTDSYWGEKQGRGFNDMVEEAETANANAQAGTPAQITNKNG